MKRDSVLIISSLHTPISVSKMSMQLLKDLVLYDYKVYSLNLPSFNKDIKRYYESINYQNHTLIGKDTNTIHEVFEILESYENKFNKIIVLGFKKYDFLMKYLEKYIGTNYNIFVVASPYGYDNDLETLVNEGAILMQSILSLKKY